MEANVICVHMDGKKCALIYCDYWNDQEQRCSLALESHKRVEMLDTLLEKTKSISMDIKEKEGLKKLVKELNIITPVNTIQ